ncbi:MAG: N-formylglutamate amidohydrolase [Rhodospirillaceae bacterium]|nr:N-formylglutamate amidohydrolase [Rhodospirillaceae bacterium]
MDIKAETPDAPSLIGPDEAPPFQVINPEGKASLLLVCDHASRAFPAATGILGLDEAALERHIAWDIGAAEVTRKLSHKLDAAAILAGYSRLLIDLNRQPGDPHSIRDISDNTIIPGNVGLTEAEQKQRVESFFHPYHQAITDTLTHLWRRRPAPALFSVHSFTPSLGGEDRFWNIGVLWGRDPRLAVPLLDKLRSLEGLHVGDNEPYSGLDVGYTIDLHGGAAGLANCAVEIRQDLLEDDAGTERWADILATIFTDLLTIENLHQVEHH